MVVQETFIKDVVHAVVIVFKAQQQSIGANPLIGLDATLWIIGAVEGRAVSEPFLLHTPGTKIGIAGNRMHGSVEIGSGDAGCAIKRTEIGGNVYIHNFKASGLDKINERHARNGILDHLDPELIVGKELAAEGDAESLTRRLRRAILSLAPARVAEAS